VRQEGVNIHEQDAHCYYSVNPSPAPGEIEVLSGGYHRCPAESTEHYRIVDACLIHHVISGKGRFHANNSTFLIGSGESFFIFPGDIYKYLPDPADPWTYRFIALKGTRILGLLGSLGITSSRPVRKPVRPKRVEFLFKHIHRSLSRLAPGYEHEAEGYVRLLLAQYALDERRELRLDFSPSGRTRMVKQAVQWLQNNYYRPVCLEELVRESGYSLGYFSKQFKATMGCTPKQYLIQLRMEAARGMLYGDLPVKSIAEKVGYTDPFYFSRLFRKTYQVSPERFRWQIPSV